MKRWSQEEESEFSNPVWFEMGLLRAEDWEGVWIEPEKEVDYDAYKPARYLRKTFTVKPGLKKARAYMTAHGVYYLYLNGKLGTEDLFSPGFTSPISFRRELMHGESSWETDGGEAPAAAEVLRIILDIR